MISFRKTAHCCFLISAVSCSQQNTEKSPEQIWKDVSPSIVYVTARGVDGKVAQGSGFFVKLEGKRWILTNRHVVQGAEEVSVAPQGKNPKRARSYKISPDLDLAVVECPTDLEAKALPLAKRQPNPGTEVFALGFPLGIANVISRGIVGAAEDKYFLFDAPISSGNSGGPVVDRAGEVIGVATMGSRNIEGAVVQNFNIGIRVSAIPRLQLFTDPLLLISNASDRIREVERFIEQGFLREDFLTLGELLQFDYFDKLRVDRGFETAEWQRKATQNEERHRAWQSKHGAIREAVNRWVEFLKKCESQIDAIPAAFAGLGNDPVLTQFLKEERTRRDFFPVTAAPELMPQLARISADHWLARLENLRYHLEWFLRYSRLPSLEELDVSNTKRPEIRLKFAITGNRDTDLQQYKKTLVEYATDERREDFFARASQLARSVLTSPPPVTDPIKSERLQGEFLQRVSSMWKYMAMAAAERCQLDEAIHMLRRDLEGRSPADESGRMLAEYLVADGKFKEAWQAFRKHFLADPPFDAFKLKQGWGGSFPFYPYLISNLVKEIEFTGIQYDSQFYKSPEIQHRADTWNAMVIRVEGRRCAELGSVADTLSSDWFNNLDEFSKLRVLVYYAVRNSPLIRRDANVRPSLDDLQEIEAALHGSPQAEAIWRRVTADNHLDYPL
jgi:S1-C subfamily serine protease